MFGVYVAYITVDRYENIVHGVLGFTILYLLYLVFLSPRRIINEPIEIDLEFPRDLKHLIFGFFLTIIIFWAGAQIIHLVWYLI